MKCLACPKQFKPTRTWNKFCSRDCSRRFVKSTRVIKHAAARRPIPCGYCKKFFQPQRKGHRFCSVPCAHRFHKAMGRTPEMRSVAWKKPTGRRRLKCHWCGGKHVSTLCQNRDGGIVNQFGTLDQDRNYVPPPGVKVRVLSIPIHVHSDTLNRLLKGGR